MAHTLFSKQCAQQYRLSPYQTSHASCPQFQTHNTHPPTLHFTTPWVTSHIDEVNSSTSVSHNPPARKLPAQYASQQKPEGQLAHFHQTSLNALNTPGKMYQSTCPAKCAGISCVYYYIPFVCNYSGAKMVEFVQRKSHFIHAYRRFVARL